METEAEPIWHDLTVTGPRQIKIALVLRRLSEESGIPSEVLAKRLSELRFDGYKREYHWRRELTNALELATIKRLSRKHRDWFIEELTDLYCYIADLEILAGLNSQTAVARDTEAEEGCFQCLLLAEPKVAMRLRSVIEPDDFCAERTKQLLRIAWPLIAMVAAGSKPELYEKEFRKTQGMTKHAVELLRFGAVWPWRFLWDEYAYRLRQTRIIRERGALCCYLENQLDDPELFEATLKSGVLQLSRLTSIDRKAIRVGL